MKTLNTILTGFVLLVSVLQVSCGPKGMRSAAHGLRTTPSQGDLLVHSKKGWQEQIAIKLHDDASDEVEDGLTAAIGVWNEAVGRDMITYRGRTSAARADSLYSSLDDNETVVYAEPNWQATTGKSEDILGTAIWENLPEDANTIYKGDIILNAETYHFDDAQNSALAKVDNLADAESVLIHEIGHLLGLNHVSSETDPYSIMAAYATIGFRQSHRQLSAGDLERIRKVYR